MKTLRRLIYRETLGAVAFVTLAFLALFFFFDMLDEMRHVGNLQGYTLGYATLKVLLGMPSHLYELLPIAVLIGVIFVMARFAQSSEFTIMRTSGLGPWLALRTLLTLGLGFVLLTVAVGDYLAPAAERARLYARTKYLGYSQAVGITGAWLKERTPDGGTLAINIAALDAEDVLHRIRIFRFDTEGRITQHLHAQSARILAQSSNPPDNPAASQPLHAWQLNQVQGSTLDYPTSSANTHPPAAIPAPQVRRIHTPTMQWHTTITRDMLITAIHKSDHMPTLELFRFVRHLQANGQSSQKYEIEFWRKVFYPLSCLVMVVLALPFAYLHFRSGGIAGYVFGGVMAGISFFLLNNVFGYAGQLQNWPPILAAAAPGLIYSILSLAAFGWLVARR